MSLVSSTIFYAGTNEFEKEFEFKFDEEMVDLDELAKSMSANFFADPNLGA